MLRKDLIVGGTYFILNDFWDIGKLEVKKATFLGIKNYDEDDEDFFEFKIEDLGMESLRNTMLPNVFSTEKEAYIILVHLKKGKIQKLVEEINTIISAKDLKKFGVNPVILD